MGSCSLSNVCSHSQAARRDLLRGKSMATYDNFGGSAPGEVQRYEQPRLTAQGVAVYSGMPQQNLRLNIVFGMGMIFSIALASFASNEWNYHDLNGLCNLLQSGPEYLHEINERAVTWGCQEMPASGTRAAGLIHQTHLAPCVTCTKTYPCCQPGVVAPGPEPLCVAGNGIYSMPECLMAVCNKHQDITFGQCKAPGLGMWGGALGVFTILAGAGAVYSRAGSSMAKVGNGACAILAITTCGVTLACFFYSFYRFGSGNIENRANFVMDGNTNGPDCNYNYSDSSGDYKTMTAFAMLTSIWSVLTSVLVCLVVPANEALLIEKENLTDGLATNMASA